MWGSIPARSRNGLSRSSGSGKTIVEFCPRDLEQRLQVAQLERRRLAAMISAASASFSAAWNSPSAWMTLRASRARPRPGAPSPAASPRGSSTSLTSTVGTLTPHGSVCSSMISWSFSLIRSRSASSSSRSAGRARCAASSARSGRCRSIVLDLDHRALGIEHAEVETALTLTGTLSRVITSCGGTSRSRCAGRPGPSGRRTGSGRSGPGPLHAEQAPSAEDHAALVLAQDANTEEQHGAKGNRGNHDRDHRGLPRIRRPWDGPARGSPPDGAGSRAAATGPRRVTSGGWRRGG